MPARDSVADGYLPLGLSHQVKLKNPVRQSQAIRWRDVEFDESATRCSSAARWNRPSPENI